MFDVTVIPSNLLQVLEQARQVQVTSGILVATRFVREREAYYAGLERSQRGDLDVTPWLAWFLGQVTAATHTTEHMIAVTLAKARFWLRHCATDLNSRQRKVLNRLPHGVLAKTA